MPKFRDIPQVTKDGTYRINVSLDWLENQIDRYVLEYNLDMDTDFQRAHVWTDVQSSDFVQHLLRGGIGSDVIRFNCPGWRSHDITGNMVVVDGKQRLTACLRFMRNEIPAFGYLYKEYEGRLRIIGPGLVFLINDIRNRADVLRWYLEINEGGVVHTQAELNLVRELLAEELG